MIAYIFIGILFLVFLIVSIIPPFDSENAEKATWTITILLLLIFMAMTLYQVITNIF